MSISLLNFLKPHIFKVEEKEDKKTNVIGGKDPFYADVTHPETATSTDFPQLQEKDNLDIYKIHDMSLGRLFKKINEQVEKHHLDKAKIFVNNNLEVLHNAKEKFSVAYPHPTSKKIYAKTVDDLIKKVAGKMKEDE